MRLDKYLKISRLIKRRTVAKEVCDGGKVKINGRVAKAGSEVHVGDVLEITFGQKQLQAQIIEIKETVKADEAKNLYKLITGSEIE